MTSRIAATGRVGRGISAAESTQSGGLPPSNDALRKVHPVLTFAASTKAGVAERDIMEYRAGIARRWRAAPPGREVIILLLEPRGRRLNHLARLEDHDRALPVHLRRLR